MRRGPYPHRGARSAEISLRGLGGREVLLKENVTFSSEVNQNNRREQMLEKGDLKVPLNLQNRSLTVQGRIRVIRDEDDSYLEAQMPEALEKESGWRFQ